MALGSRPTLAICVLEGGFNTFIDLRHDGIALGAAHRTPAADLIKRSVAAYALHTGRIDHANVHAWGLDRFAHLFSRALRMAPKRAM